MSNFRKKAIALAAVACVALTSAASCSKSKTESSSNGGNNQSSANEAPTQGITIDQIENEDGKFVVTPFQSGSASELAGSGLTPNENVDLDSDDPVSTETKEPATEIVDVTEANGEKVTDANGQTVTEVVTKPTEAPGNNYVSKTDSRYCLWVDISKDSDFVFNDDFVEVYFKLKDNIPEKDYAVRFNPDFSSVKGVSLTPDKVIQGNIRVGGEIEAQDVSAETGFVAYGDNVSAKPGDEIVYRINLKNNPGMAGLLLWIYYDSNAMDVEDIIPSGEFATFASGTSTGSKPKN